MTNSLREDLVAAMAQIYGYEHPNTIEFAYLCENPQNGYQFFNGDLKMP